MDNYSKLYRLTTYGLMCALMCILGPISIPIGPIPVSLTILIICISVILIGSKGTFISYLMYLFLGAFGLPVFSGFQGGLAKLTGPTGGYLIGFILLIQISGLFYKKSHGSIVFTLIGMTIGIVLDYALGTLWFVCLMKCSFSYALTVCVYPFIPVDIAKLAVANVVGRLVRKPLLKQGLVPGQF